MRANCRAGVLAAACLLMVAGGCRRAETSADLQSLDGELAPAATEVARGAATGGRTGELDGLPLVSSPFPGLGGRLHSALCDPASDIHSNCI